MLLRPKVDRLVLDTQSVDLRLVRLVNFDCAPLRFRAKREQLTRFEGPLLENHRQNLTLTVSFVPCLLKTGRDSWWPMHAAEGTGVPRS